LPYVSHPLIYPEIVEDREYQRTISEASKNKNSLVVLPTALGKTVISAIVAVDVLYNYREKRVLVMAPTRPLCMQHMETFRRVMRLPEDDFVLLTGKTQAAFREAVWNGKSRMVFATPQVVRNDLLAKRMTLNGFGLLVFDECHRSVKEYAYTEIANQYAKTSEYPLILGMTASHGSDIARVRNVCESLFIEHVEYRNDEDPDVSPYVQPITVEWKTVELPPAYQPVRDVLKGMLDERVRWLQGRGYLKGAFKEVSRRQLIELGAELRYTAEMSIEEERGPIYAVISRQASALTIFHMLDLLETQGAHTLKAFVKRMMDEAEKKKSHSVMMREQAFTSLHDLLNGESLVEHTKVDALKNLLGDQFGSSSDSRVLVFTQYRDTATYLVQELNKVSGIRAERFVGQASKLHDKGLTQDEQATIIKDLRKGYVNTLVATSIAEEGLDIPQVDLVVFYEPIPSEIRYIQRRGRTGRKTAGKVVILAAQNTYDMIYLYASQNRVERMKGITQKLNTILKPVLRLRSRPAPAPLSPDDLTEIYARTTLKPELTIIATPQTEKERLSEMRRQVSRAERAVYMKILEDGMIGIDNEALCSELEEEGYSRDIVKVALSRLVKAKHISDMQGPSHLSVPFKEMPGTRKMTIEVEKIASGHAIVWVDGKWRARLIPENYAGPRELIKKGKSFEALCSLYHDEGVLCVNVRQVVQARA
jgi:Fanconi anemia group M protein